MLLVLGDVMTDVYVDGLVHRMSPDAPVPVLLRTHASRRISGACIAAEAAKEATGDAVGVAAVVGDDEPAAFLGSTLRGAGLTPLLGTVPGCATITKTRFRTGSHPLLRVDEDGSFSQHVELVEDHMFEVWRTMRARTSVVLFSDYVKGTLTEALVRQVIRDARSDGTKVVVDSKRRDVSCYACAHVWTPNEHELVIVSGQADLEAAAIQMRQRLDLEAVIVTRAERGAMLMLEDGGNRRIAPPALDRVRSVAGGGDVLAGVVAGLAAQGATWADAADEGVRRATRFVGREPAGELVPDGDRRSFESRSR